MAKKTSEKWNSKPGAHIRQGDVLVMVKPVPKGLKAAKPEDKGENAKWVFAHGEATGHRHYVPMRRSQMFEGATSGGAGSGTQLRGGPQAEALDLATMYVRVAEETALKHDEHTAIPIPCGDFVVIRQREYTPQGIVRVSD